MDSIEIPTFLTHLGVSHEELIEKNIIPDDDLIELFPGVGELFLEIVTGVDISFDPVTEKFQTLNVTLKQTTPSTVEYTGELPPPFKHNMTQEYVRASLGSPRHYSGPVKMPEPMGQTGGWESYHLNVPGLEGIELIVGYTESMEVEGLAFSNFRREDMYRLDSDSEEDAPAPGP